MPFVLNLKYIIIEIQERKKGVFRKYQTFECNDSKVKGRIDVTRHIKLNSIFNGNIAYSTREYTVNNLINQLILLTYECLKKKYPGQFNSIVNERERLKKDIEILKKSSPNYTELKPQNILKQTQKPIYHPVFMEYEPLRKTCIMILRRMGINIFESNSNMVYGVVIDMNKLWEKFLYKDIFKDIINGGEIYSQEKVNILEGKRNIELDFYSKDIGIVMDAKYRSAWGNTLKENEWNKYVREDVFQILAYMYTLDVKVGGVIFPTDKPLKENNHYFDFFKVSDKQNDKRFLRIPYYIPIEIADYNKFEENMGNNGKKVKEFIENIIKQQKELEENIMFGQFLDYLNRTTNGKYLYLQNDLIVACQKTDYIFSTKYNGANAWASNELYSHYVKDFEDVLTGMGCKSDIKTDIIEKMREFGRLSGIWC